MVWGLLNFQTKLMKTFILFACVACIQASIAQQKLTKTFYDFKKSKVKEEFFTDSDGVKNGIHKGYSEFGGILVQGTNKSDTKVGTYTHWDENLPKTELGQKRCWIELGVI